MAFAQRIINTTVSLAQGAFEGGGNSATLTGLRTSLKIEQARGQSQGSFEMAIYGMTLSQMNQLSTLGTEFTQRGNNRITIDAGDSINGVSTIYMGYIMDAWIDGQAQPNVPFRINGQSVGYQAVKPVTPTSYKGPTPVATIMGGLAGLLGMTFENNGVTGVLSNPYFAGDAHSQVVACAKAAGCEYAYDKGTLAICPPNGSRAKTPVLISPQTGLVGYPMFRQTALILRVLLNTSVAALCPITVQSDITAACGQWTVNNVVYELDSIVPHGRWFMIVATTGASQPNAP
jgi:hypothetical protein